MGEDTHTKIAKLKKNKIVTSEGVSEDFQIHDNLICRALFCQCFCFGWCSVLQLTSDPFFYNLSLVVTLGQK